MTASINPERLKQLETISLDHGSHLRFDEGHCAIELVAWLAGEPHSDEPQCVCPILTGRLS